MDNNDRLVPVGAVTSECTTTGHLRFVDGRLQQQWAVQEYRGLDYSRVPTGTRMIWKDVPSFTAAEAAAADKQGETNAPQE